MQFRILLSKNWIYWKRNKAGSIAEIVLPVALCLLMLVIKPQITSTDYEQSSPTLIPSLTPSIMQFAQSQNAINSSLITQISRAFKNCSDAQRGGGYIALAPQFQITSSLQSFFKSLNLTTRYFNSSSEIDDEVISSNYTLGTFETGMNQICFGIVFDSYTNGNYSYSLRFNMSGNTPDFYDTSGSPRINYQKEDQKSFNQTITSGILSLQILIDSLIIQNNTGVKISAGYEKFVAPAYSFADFQGTVTNMIVLCLILCSVIPFIRIIAHIVGEREERIIENMENMGLSKGLYILSVYIFMTFVHLLIAIICTLFLKLGILFNVNTFMIFLTYFLFIMSNNAIALFISCFFSKAKKAIIVGLLIFLLLFLFYILRSSVLSPSSGLVAFISITPTGAMNNLIINYMKFANYYQDFGFDLMSFEVFYFKASTYFIVTVIEWIVFTLLSFYCIYVVPLEFGIVEHPLFIFGFKNTEESVLKELEAEEQPINNITDKFEMVEEEFKMQEAQNKTLKIQNLFKIYPNKKLAVKNLSMDMYSDQIFALLGHNGAGKTTTLSMISGLYTITKGSIKIMGFDTKFDHNEIKKHMGICPQNNPLFSYMTVQEHMELFSQIKGPNVDSKAEIEYLLKEIDLYHKRNYLAGKLSGGQKRKLCVALAFVGNSKVILLDEPTSGMDTYARRHLWEMLKKYKKDKIIILTTHNMDEADFLGDRIGIMSDGELATCGSPLFLKTKFGDGYELIVLKKQGFEEQSFDELKALVKTAIPNSSIISEIGTELKFRLPENSSGFQDFFNSIEINQEKFGIQSFGINLNTLEDVFIKVTKIASGRLLTESKIDQSKVENKPLNSESTKMIEKNMKNLNESPLNMDLRALTENNDSSGSRQLKALLKKRVLYISRDLSTILCEIICPIIIVIIGLGLAKINFFVPSPKLFMTPKLYQNSLNFTSNQLISNGVNLPQSILGKFDPLFFSYNQTSTPSDLNTFAMTIFNQNRTSQLFALYFESISSQAINYTLLFNTTAPFVQFVAINQLNNAILKAFSPNSAPTITFALNPLGLTNGWGNLNATVDGFIIVILILQAFALIPNSLIQFIIKERENNAKHQQIVSGASIGMYWISNFIIDYIKYLIPGLTIYGLFFAFGATFLTDGDKSAYVIIMILIYGIALVAMTYILSFFFKSPGNGQIFAFLFFSFFSFVLVIVSFVLKVIPSTRDIGIDVIPYIFNIFAPFNFGNSLMNLSNDFLYKVIYRWPSIPSAFDKKIAQNELIYLICFTIFYCIVIFMIEYWQTFRFLSLKKTTTHSKFSSITSSVDLDQNIDESVIHEEENVKKQMKAYSVYVEDLSKRYFVPNPEKFCGKITKKAVDKITFGIEQGSVFCLLGTNGAGKTTTFKILTGDISATSGNAYIRGLRLPEELSKIRQFVGYCPQFDSLTDKLTAEEHLRLYCDLKGIHPKYQEELIDNMIESLNLQKFRKVQAGTYSGGNKRKLSIAIALIGHPPIVFLDEPSAGMDPEARRFMWSFIAEISSRRAHSSIILTTHSMDEAQALANKVAIMVEGKIKTIGTVQRLKDKFGKGFEIEIKIKIPNDLKMKELFENFNNLVNFKNQEMISVEESKILLSKLQMDHLNEEITKNGKGSAIHQRFIQGGAVEANLLIEWIEIQSRINLIKGALKDKFEAKMIESYQTYAKFNINDKYKLSEIFGFMEVNTSSLEIANFAVREISLEQIFIQFAQNILHED